MTSRGKDEWFHRMGDIPGLGYTAPVPIDRASLPDHDKEPELRRYDFDNEPRVLVDWGLRETSEPDAAYEDKVWTPLGSPAIEHLREVLDDGARPTSEQLLRRLWEALELPGAADDYHHALERVGRRLRTMSYWEPAVMENVEALAWLDIRLMRTYPSIVIIDHPEAARPYWGADAFNTLHDIYVAEGFLRDALAVCELELEFGADPRRTDELRARLERMASESAL
jgi:hypothetical protein